MGKRVWGDGDFERLSFSCKSYSLLIRVSSMQFVGIVYSHDWIYSMKSDIRQQTLYILRIERRIHSKCHIVIIYLYIKSTIQCWICALSEICTSFYGGYGYMLYGKINFPWYLCFFFATIYRYNSFLCVLEKRSWMRLAEHNEAGRRSKSVQQECNAFL